MDQRVRVGRRGPVVDEPAVRVSAARPSRRPPPCAGCGAAARAVVAASPSAGSPRATRVLSREPAEAQRNGSRVAAGADRAPTRGREASVRGLGQVVEQRRSRNGLPPVASWQAPRSGSRRRARAERSDRVSRPRSAAPGGRRPRPARPRSGEGVALRLRVRAPPPRTSEMGVPSTRAGEVRQPAQRGSSPQWASSTISAERAALGGVHRQPVAGRGPPRTAARPGQRPGPAPRGPARRRPRASLARPSDSEQPALEELPHHTPARSRSRCAPRARSATTEPARAESSSVVLPIPAGPSTTTTLRPVGRPRTPARPSRRSPSRSSSEADAADYARRGRARLQPISMTGTGSGEPLQLHRLAPSLAFELPTPSARPSRWRVSGRPPPPRRAARPPRPAHRSSPVLDQDVARRDPNSDAEASSARSTGALDLRAGSRPHSRSRRKRCEDGHEAVAEVLHGPAAGAVDLASTRAK